MESRRSTSSDGGTRDGLETVGRVCSGRSTHRRVHLSLAALPRMAVMSIFFMLIIAAKTRLASSPPASTPAVSARGLICQQRPQRSLHQPHWFSAPPLPTIAFQYRFRLFLIVRRDSKGKCLLAVLERRAAVETDNRNAQYGEPQPSAHALLAAGYRTGALCAGYFTVQRRRRSAPPPDARLCRTRRRSYSLASFWCAPCVQSARTPLYLRPPVSVTTW